MFVAFSLKGYSRETVSHFYLGVWELHIRKKYYTSESAVVLPPDNNGLRSFVVCK